MKRLKVRAGLLAACAMLALAITPSTARAAVIISPVTATASTEFSPVYSIINTINHAGLLTNFVSGVTNFDAYLAGNPMHTLIADLNEWFSAEGVTTATIVYDLGSVKRIDRLALWNEEFSGFGTGALSASVDNVSYNPLGLINPVDSPADLDYGAQVFNLGLIDARYIRFEIRGCPQANGSQRLLCGIGEVAFSQVPEPVSMMLFGVSAVGLAARARRRSRQN